MSHENSPSFSEEEEEEVYESNRNPAGDISGTLSKWTNYIHGWQDRFIVLKDGTLSYYKVFELWISKGTLLLIVGFQNVMCEKKRVGYDVEK